MRLIVVSNRVSSLSNPEAAAGGLAAALYEGMRKSGGIWFGWSGKTVETAPGPTEIVTSGPAQLATIDYPEDEFKGFYNGMANGTLWPVMHRRVDLMVYDDDAYEKYCAINRLVASRVAELADSETLLWVHDYHFLPLAADLRELGITTPIGFFFHTPFAPYACIECIPRHQALFRQMLDYDLIGFQTNEDLENFHHYALRQLPCTADGPQALHYGQRTVRLGVFPVGVDVDKYADLAAIGMQEPQVAKLAGVLDDTQRLIIGVDRLDYSKGLPLRFRAFERLLLDHPEYREKISLLQIAPLSRSDVSAYQSLQEELQGLIGRITGQFSNPGWQPLRYTNESYSSAVLAGFYRLSQVCCITPLCDGMNLVAKEYVASQPEADPGVLVLSKFAGAAQELDAALIVNPYDIGEVAQALETALSMPLAERQNRWRAMMKVLRVNSVGAWFDGFTAQLQKAGTSAGPWRKFLQRVKH
jgi:trehalose 6-phosphate synthase